MMKLELADGRQIELVSLSLRGTYSGHLEGSRTSVSDHILARLRDTARHRPLQIIADPPVLARYQCEAHFTSEGLSEQTPQLESALTVVWFTDHIPDALSDLLLPLASAVRWLEFARECDPWDI